MGVVLCVGGCNYSFQPQVYELNEVELRLRDCRERLEALLVPPGPNVGETVDELRALGDELADLDRRAGLAVDKVVDVHLTSQEEPMGPVMDPLGKAKDSAGAMLAAIDDFLDATPANLLPPEFRAAVEDIRSILGRSMVAVGLRYYRHYIPIRFVQFFVHSSDLLSEEQLEYNIGLANHIFFPTRMRFFLRKNTNLASYQFEDLYLRDANGEYILNDSNNIQDAYYTWPEDLTRSPLIHGIHYPYYLSCPDFVRPEGNVETRYMAQMRAGTYCCPEGEILVYINQSKSNGGQYPWFSRIIGMTSGHMARSGSHRNKFTFVHELVHYFGVPHTFPNHTRYWIDYDLARMIDHPQGDDDPPIDQRRFYGPHEHLINPETGQMAELSLFWDMFFVPVCTPDAGTFQLFFDSRQEAAQYEDLLQPIEEWGNGRLYRKTQGSCGDPPGRARLELTVAAGCRGIKGDFTDCICPAETLCTGDRAVRAFSRPGSNPDTIHLNVMSYGYPMADGTDVPHDMVEMTFLSESQIGQIERVMDPGNEVDNRFFRRGKGLRPKLGSCTDCHDWVGS